MARKTNKSTGIYADDESDASPEAKAHKKRVKGLHSVHKEAMRRYKLCTSDASEKENRENYREDMRFTYVPGEQWDRTTKDERGKDRPMYEFNETRVKCMTVINHIRANRPAAKIRGVEEADKERAEIRQGLYLNITNNSDFDSIKDYAAGHQVAGGMGAWRIDTEYSTDTAFDQDIVIKTLVNPLALRWDPSDKDELKRKAKYLFIESKISNEEYETRWPSADRVSFEVDDDMSPDDDDESTWVAEYWSKKPAVKNICLLSDGKSIDKDELAKKQGVTPDKVQLPEGVTVVKERKVNTFKICQYIVSGDSVLEGPNEWAGSMFPFVPVYGYYVVVDGRVYWGGLTRYMKDAQRAHNWAMTSVYETIAGAPQAQYWATADQAKGHINQWAEAHRKNLPALLYNPDPATGGQPPQRMGGADVPAALIQGAQMSSAAMNTTSGITLANEGRTSNETSGKAIRARQDEGMVATFNFGDNMAKSERRTCEIINDLFPKIYDTKRSIRILSQEGAEKFVKINDVDPVTGEVINDMSAGKFDFVVTTGPSFATQRQEAAEFYTEMSRTDPLLSQVAGDLIIKAHDYPMSDAIAERRKMALPPQIQQQLSQDKPLPPEVQAAMAQAEQAMQAVQQQGQLVQQAAQEVEQEKAGAEKAKADVKVELANLKVAEANLAKQVAEFKAMVAEAKSQMAVDQAKNGDENEKAELSSQLAQALADIQSQAAQLFQQYTQQLAEMQAQALQTIQPQVVIPPRARRRKVVMSRVNGQLVGEAEDIPDEVAA